MTDEELAAVEQAVAENVGGPVPRATVLDLIARVRAAESACERAEDALASSEQERDWQLFARNHLAGVLQRMKPVVREALLFCDPLAAGTSREKRLRLREAVFHYERACEAVRNADGFEEPA